MGNYDFSLDLESKNTMSVINGWIKEGSRVLEFGPANGRLTKYLKEEKHCRMTIVEIDAETGKEASAYAEKAYLGQEGDIENYHWTGEREPFDAIIFADVLEHLRDPERVMREAAALLKPEGELLVSVPNITHNSILIGLINDQFDYDDTGLLDRTHVHFFSYDSFVKMCGRCNTKIVEMTPIYSRVGDNEIPTCWREVPAVLERELRKRAHGGVYQYVYRICRGESTLPICTQLPEVMPGEDRASFEMQLYYRNGQEDYTEEKCIRSVYHDGEEVLVTLDLTDKGSVSELRFDPMAESGLVELISATIEDASGTKVLQPRVNSASVVWNRWYLFRENDPRMFFRFPQEMQRGKVMLRFRLSEYRIDGDHADLIGSLLAERNMEVELLRKENAEAADYVRRMEKEVQELKNRMEKEVQELKNRKGLFQGRGSRRG